jgi:hypothetical protein
MGFGGFLQGQNGLMANTVIALTLHDLMNEAAKGSERDDTRYLSLLKLDVSLDVFLVPAVSSTGASDARLLRGRRDRRSFHY